MSISISMAGEPYWSEPKPRKKHWYFIDEYYCPICARSSIYKVRRYSKRPEKFEDRHSMKEVYDYCD